MGPCMLSPGSYHHHPYPWDILVKIAFIAALGDKHLARFLAPLSSLSEVQEIGLFRRRRPPDCGNKVRWQAQPTWMQRFPALAEGMRLLLILLRARHYDVLVGCFQRYHGVWAWLAGMIHGKPVIQLVITDVDWNRERPLLNFVMQRAAACTVMGEVGREKLARTFDGPIGILSLPIPLPPPPPPKRPIRYDLLSVAAYAVEKDFPWMMEIMAEVKKARPQVRLAMCGGGLQETIGPLIDHHGLHEQVEILGFVSEARLKQAYGESRALLLTSRWEGLATVALEAMSQGVPALVTGAGDLPWLVRDGIDGRVFDHGDTASFVAAIIKMLDNPEDWEEKGRQARQRIEEVSKRFTREAMTEEWQGLLRALR